MAATLVERSGCYAKAGLILSRNEKERKRKREEASEARELGQKWASEDLGKEVQALWTGIVAAWDTNVGDGSATSDEWKRCALRLVAITDEACEGIGFLTYNNDSVVAEIALEELIKSKEGLASLFLPSSLCLYVEPELACVLPKSLTPEVGCTIRSLTHHLALLPGRGLVRSQYYLSTSPQLENVSNCEHALNLLLVPFPYFVFGTDFVVARAPERGENEEENVDGYFSLRQGWLTDEFGIPISRQMLASFIAGLLNCAQAEGGPVHGIVFPETSLTREYLLDLADDLAPSFAKLDFIVCGTLAKPDNKPSTQGRNDAVIIRLEQGKRAGVLVQSKHHRWRLEAGQIARYHLGQILDPQFAWWENIGLGDRTMQFGLNSHEAVVSALVCEDLARFDPVMPVLMAVGPNLVFVLLMDGPQFEGRWSGRYATALAEDPGSSILTFTCAGMVRRWGLPGEATPCNVGLWKSRGDKVIPLTLPQGAHALTLALTTRSSSQRSLDLRPETGVAKEYKLGGVRSVRHPDPPRWIDRPLSTA